MKSICSLFHGWIRSATWWGLFGLAALSCSNGGTQQVSKSVPPRTTESVTRRSVEPNPNQPLTPTPSPAPKESMVESYRFSRHLSDGHLRSGGILVDFGTPARHKHTLGDWRSGFTGNVEKDKVTFSYMTGRTARIAFHAFEEEVGGGRFAVRAKGHGPNQVKVYLNDDYKGALELTPKGFSHAEVRFDDGIQRGRNVITLRCNARGKTGDGQFAAMSIDYARMTFDQNESGPAASAFDAVRYRNAGGEDDHIVLTTGESLTYYLPIPEGARLTGKVSVKNPGTPGAAAITVQTDDAKKQASWSRDLGGATSTLALDLSPLAGETAAVTFSAVKGEVLFRDAAIVSPPPSSATPPGKLAAKNVVWVLIDTLRADKLELYNSETRVSTPYLSRLGAESVTFERALAAENWTKPSVASFLTGLYPTTHGTKDDRDKLPGSVVTIQEHLKGLGFVTAGFVANGYVSAKFGFRRGFDVWTNYVREGKANRAQYVVGDAVAWLRKKTDDKPFFLYVHTIDPHVPYIPPKKYLKMYDVGPYNGPVSARETAKLAEKIKTHRITLNDRDKMRFEALYDGEISYHDDQLVHLHDALKEMGLLDDTLVIVTSDHGEEFFDHGLVGHGHSLYEELLHVPLLIRLPNDDGETARRGTVIDREVSLTDLFPTTCDLLGVECPDDVEGRSLAPLLRGETLPSPNAAAAEFLGGQRALRAGRYKLILRGDRITLFDLETDPRETTDLSDERPIALTAMTDRLGAHLGRFSRVSRPAAKAAAHKPVHKPEKAVLDAETKKQLKALGYLGGE